MQYDSIVIGAGHNGLTCAAYLARAGQKVLVLEASPEVGGLAATREFHPGFQATIAHSASHFPSRIIRELGLESHGLDTRNAPQSLTGLSQDGNHVVINGLQLTGVSAADQAAWPEYNRLMETFAKVLEPFWLKTIPRIAYTGLKDLVTYGQIGLGLKRLGKDDMREFLRVVALPTRDLMDEHFENPVLKALVSWDGLIGSRMAPRSPNNAVLAMLYRMAERKNGSTPLPVNSVKKLVSALQSAASAAGVEIRTDCLVRRILVKGDESGLKATGVELSDGSRIGAERVVSSADPKRTFLGLAGVENLEIGFTNRIRRLRCNGLVAKLHLALSDLPEFSGLDHPAGRLIIAPEMDAIEFAFDDSKYGRFSSEPVMEVTLPSIEDPSFAPVGQHVLSAHVMYVPYMLENGWDEESREALCEAAISMLERYAPGLRSILLQKEILTPLDLERVYGVSGGHWHHTEFALDQALMMRPTYEAAQYSTPIPGLFLCGAGSHPGGDLTGAPGHNAAQEILR